MQFYRAFSRATASAARTAFTPALSGRTATSALASSSKHGDSFQIGVAALLSAEVLPQPPSGVPVTFLAGPHASSASTPFELVRLLLSPASSSDGITFAMTADTAASLLKGGALSREASLLGPNSVARPRLLAQAEAASTITPVAQNGGSSLQAVAPEVPLPPTTLLSRLGKRLSLVSTSGAGLTVGSTAKAAVTASLGPTFVLSSEDSEGSTASAAASLPPVLPGKGNHHEASASPSGNASEGHLHHQSLALVMRLCGEGDVLALKHAIASLPSGTTLASWHDSDNGATPLHLLVTSPLAISADASDEDAALLQEGIELLVGRGVDVNAPAANGSTALHWAAGFGSVVACKALLARGADVYGARSFTWRRNVFGKDSGATPLHWAAQSNKEAVVKLLAQHSLPSVLATDERGLTPAAVAAKELASGAESMLKAMEGTPLVFVRLRLKDGFVGKASADTATTASAADADI